MPEFLFSFQKLFTIDLKIKEIRRKKFFTFIFMRDIAVESHPAKRRAWALGVVKGDERVVVVLPSFFIDNFFKTRLFI